MMEESARTGYMDLILAAISLAILPFNFEVAFILLVWAMYVYVTTRFGSFRQTSHPEAIPPQDVKPSAKPRPRRAQRQKPANK